MANKYIVFSSGGNDSIAVIATLAATLGLTPEGRGSEVHVIYQNTGWAAPGWQERIEAVEAWCAGLGFKHHTQTSMGFENLVRTMGNRKGEAPGRFPSGREKFCTRHLKILPSEEFLKTVDEERMAICLVGVRRAESERRKHTPVFVPVSINHGNRPLWNILAEMSDEQRDAVVATTPIPLLPHRSEECEPCIFSSRQDLRRVTPEKVDVIRQIESDTGKTMFRPRAYAGATGIDEIMKWAWSERGQYKPPVDLPGAKEDDVDDPNCDSDRCGL